MEPVGLKSHMLIRVGLNVGVGEWFGRETDFSSYRKAAEITGSDAEPGVRQTAGDIRGTAGFQTAGSDAGPGARRNAGDASEPESYPGRMQEQRKAGGFWRRILRLPVRCAGQSPGERSREERESGKRICRKRENRKQEHRKRENRKQEHRKREDRRQESRDAAERRRLQAEWEESIHSIEQEIIMLASEIPELAGEDCRCYAVYEDSVRKALIQAEEDIFADWDSCMNREADGAREVLMNRGSAGGREVLMDKGSAGSREVLMNRGSAGGREVLMDQESPGAGTFRGSASGSHILSALWQKYMDYEEFSGYMKPFWVEMLMPKAALYHFVILGTAPCIPELIEKYAGRMKSLKWILSENTSSPELMEFVEDFYIEYGLAISLQVLSCEGEWKRLGMLCGVPSNILDFTVDSWPNAPRAAEGSIWLDFGSVEEKKHRIEGRCSGVVYFSLKDKWRRAQRRCKEPLLP